MIAAKMVFVRFLEGVKHKFEGSCPQAPIILQIISTP